MPGASDGVTCAALQAERAELLWARNERRRAQIKAQLAATARALEAERVADLATLRTARRALAEMPEADESGAESGAESEDGQS